MKGVMRFGKRDKLSPGYIGPFKILWTVGDMAYELALAHDLSTVHPIFHISMLRCYFPNESHVISWELIQLDERLSFVKETVSILNRDIWRLGSRVIPVEIEELKNRLKGIEEGLMFFQESTTRLLQLGKKISIDVGKGEKGETSYRSPSKEEPVVYSYLEVNSTDDKDKKGSKKRRASRL
ncbi:putative cytochrome 83B1-like [Capsicum annuum]|nr:putative cytochrome 83B1-like [Capsicum annuum]